METLFTCRQWELRVKKRTDGEVEEYEIVNPHPDPNGTPQRRFFRAFSGKYGEPVIEPEPDLAFPPPAAVQYIDRRGQQVLPDQKISGIICREADGTTAKSADGQIALRLSLTNALTKGVAYTIADDGKLQLGGRDFHLQVLVLKDKNRFRNYDAYFGTTKPDNVLFLELEDLVPLPPPAPASASAT